MKHATLLVQKHNNTVGLGNLTRTQIERNKTFDGLLVYNGSLMDAINHLHLHDWSYNAQNYEQYIQQQDQEQDQRSVTYHVTFVLEKYKFFRDTLSKMNLDCDKCLFLKNIIGNAYDKNNGKNENKKKNGNSKNVKENEYQAIIIRLKKLQQHLNTIELFMQHKKIHQLVVFVEPGINSGIIDAVNAITKLKIFPNCDISLQNVNIKYKNTNNNMHKYNFRIRSKVDDNDDDNYNLCYLMKKNKFRKWAQLHNEILINGTQFKWGSFDCSAFLPGYVMICKETIRDTDDDIVVNQDNKSNNTIASTKEIEIRGSLILVDTPESFSQILDVIQFIMQIWDIVDIIVIFQLLSQIDSGIACMLEQNVKKYHLTTFDFNELKTKKIQLTKQNSILFEKLIQHREILESFTAVNCYVENENIQNRFSLNSIAIYTIFI